ncbi:MAG: hypothetical protein ACI84C_001885 [Flavobacteriales bacterium]
MLIGTLSSFAIQFVAAMNIFKFRVIIDTDEDIFRDIEIETTGTFLDLHESILRAFDWDPGEMASFYMSNETWDRGDEIPLMDMGEPESGLGEGMDSVVLNSKISKPDEKLVYVYDFMRMWCFYIELQEIKKSAPSTLYPRVAMAYGEAPAIEEKEIDFGADFDFLEEGAEEKKEKKPDLTGDPEIDAYLSDMDDSEGDDSHQDEFENLDDWKEEF